MQNQTSVRNNLLSPNIINSQIQQPPLVRQQPHYQSVKQLNQQRAEAQSKMRGKYWRLKDESLIVKDPPLPFYAQWLAIMDKKYAVIYPESKILLAWNFFMVIAILFNFFEIPMALFLTSSVYETQVNTSQGLLFNIIFLLGFYIDIVVFGFNTAYYQKGKLITKRIIIAKKYMKIQFWVDVLSTLILTLYIVSGQSVLIYLKIFYYIKIYSLLQKDSSIMHFLELHRISFAIYKLVRMIIFLWFITTWAGCIFFAIDYYYYNQKGYYYQQNQLWLTNSDAAGNLNLITNFEWYVWYQYGLYWALQTSSTIGYGDLTPMNPPQVLFCCFVMLLMTVLFAFFINTVWQIIGELQLSTVQYSENWQNLKVFLGGSQIPSETKQKISNYLYEVWQDTDNQEIQEIINAKLSRQLKEEFYFQSRWKFFETLGIFLMLVEPGTRGTAVLGQLAHNLQEIKIGEGQYIYQQENFMDSVYYIRKGKVQLAIQGSALSQSLKFNESFGVVQFFMRKKSTHSATAVVFCKLWVLEYSDMLKCLQKYSYVYEKFCEITQKMVLTDNITPLDLECWNCKDKSHCLSKCPAVNDWRKSIKVYGNQQKQTHYEAVSVERSFFRRNHIKTRKIIQRSAPIQQINYVKVEKVTHTKYYCPFYNIK